MTKEQLENTRIACGLNQSEMARQMETPLRTYQDWEAGRRRIPGVAGVAARLICERDEWVTKYAVEKACAGYKP